MKQRKIKFVCNAVRWFDRLKGNIYHSVRITRVKDGLTIASGFKYGYEEAYKQTALDLMLKNNWLPKKYGEKEDNRYASVKLYLYERENSYPIIWNVSEGLKRACLKNGVV